jgi:hypothetical protein
MTSSNSIRTTLVITDKQFADIEVCFRGTGGEQNFYRRLHKNVLCTNGKLTLPVSNTDLEQLKRRARRKTKGTWQDTARDILLLNGITWDLEKSE